MPIFLFWVTTDSQLQLAIHTPNSLFQAISLRRTGLSETLSACKRSAAELLCVRALYYVNAAEMFRTYWKREHRAWKAPVCSSFLTIFVYDVRQRKPGSHTWIVQSGESLLQQ